MLFHHILIENDYQRFVHEFFLMIQLNLHNHLNVHEQVHQWMPNEV